jgi:glutamate-1-semialdehyde 2,1-aminomutase
MLTPFFDIDHVRDYKSATASDTGQFAAFFNRMLNQGIYLPPSQFEAVFVSLAHTEEDIQRTVAAASRAFTAIAR